MPELKYSVDHNLARIELSQPERLNAMTLEMWVSLPSCLAQAAADPDVRAIVLEGAGDRAFCAGADISQFASNRAERDAVAIYDRAFDQACAALSLTSKPTLALIKGICFGGGFGLAMACDIRLVRADARFCIPAARLGLGYSFAGMRILIRKLGPDHVADLLFSAREIDAPEALRMGIATKVFEADAFLQGSAAYVDAVGANAPLTLLATKAALNEIARRPHDPDGEEVDRLIQSCSVSADYREGRAAFTERRIPQFAGV